MNQIGKLRIAFSRHEIADVKVRALRRRVWYSVLTKGERAYMNLVTRLVESVRSRLLAKVVSSIITKLEAAMESRVHRLIREIGGDLAAKLSGIAQGWGHTSAAQWVDDPDFQQYVTITYMNTPS